MYLKRLEIQGFKSFVDKTVLEFDKGITAIVGPNGSGKSNISDAVKWVLGEQSPKTLRGGKMEDVIFAGTENRRPVGMAEVSLIMDNSDRTLNIDYSEVKITRRLYRSGESEYLINGSLCRLKDIQLLFADTGIGKDGFSIIGQGKVDEILNSKSNDRRGIFEDASGIMKYRMRKEESERKLNNTEQNLVRINDILGELERQIGPLEKQAEKARKYLTLKYELRDIEVGDLVDTIKDSSVKMEETDKNIFIVEDQIKQTEEKLENVKRENQEKTEKSKALEEQIYREREKGHEIGNLIERINSSIKINENNINTLKQAVEKNDMELSDLSNRNIKLQNDVANVDERILVTEEQIEEARQKISDMQERYNAVMSLLSDDSREAEKLKDWLYELRLRLSQKDSEKESCRSNIERLDKRNIEIRDEIENANKEHLEIDDLIKKAEEEYIQSASLAESFKKEWNENADKLNGMKVLYDNKTNSLSDTAAEMKSQQARLRLMSEMQEKYEGYARSVKEILTFCRQNASFGRGIHGSVAEIINVPAEYELAVESAIGAAYQNIVTDTEDEAKKAIDYLKQKNYGRATFLPISAVQGRTIDSNTERQLKTMPGFVGIAANLVRYDGKFGNIVNNLLGRVVIFTDLDSCINAARRFKYSFVCVTLGGDILRTSGAMTGGSTNNNNKTNVFARTREIPALERSVKQLSSSLDSLKHEIVGLRENINRLEKEQNSILDKIRKQEIQTERAKNVYNAFVEKKGNLDKKVEDLMRDADRNVNEISVLKERTNAIDVEIVDINNQIMEKSKELAQYEEKSKQGAEVRNVLTNELTKAQVEENEIKNRLNNLFDEKKRLLNEIASNEDKKNYLKLQIDEDSSRIKELVIENEEYASRIKKQVHDKDDNSALLARLTVEKSEIDANLSGMIEKISEITGEISNLREELSRLAFRKTKLEETKESCLNRLWDEYELTYTKACEISSFSGKINKEARRKRINELKQEMKELGNVNVGAIDELEEVKTRYEFMSEQYNDMHTAKQKLLEVIDEMNKVMKEQFTKQFDQIRRNFNEVFCELFGGGKADIILTDEANVLESGIEIEVQPPGKKLQNMLLLSGGERALTAIALLFAILRMRPSPFCLLDEIEASLDEANVYRFGRFLLRGSDKTQFIMVTHRKGTMEIAETMYGVTMEEKGISKVVSMKLGGVK